MVYALNENKLPPDISLEVHYILSQACLTRTAEGMKVVEPPRSTHGLGEVEEDIRQLVIRKYFPDKWGAYIMKRSYQFESSYWDEAAEGSGLALSAVRQHARSEEGKTLLMQDALIAAELGIAASPTFLWENRVILRAESLKKVVGLELEPTGSCH